MNTSGSDEIALRHVAPTRDAGTALPFGAIIGTVALCLACAEAVVLANASWAQLYQDYTQETHDSYVADSRAQLAELKALDGSVWRFDKTYTRAGLAALNEGMALGYNAISSYTSSSNQKAVSLLNGLGYSNPGEFLCRYAAPVLLLDSLLGVKYVSTLPTEVAPEGYTLTSVSPTSDGYLVYENPRALSMGYAVSETALTASLPITDGLGDPFAAQNALVSGLTGGTHGDCYVPLAAEGPDVSDAARSWRVSVPEGSIGYVYLQPVNCTGFALTIDGNEQHVDAWRFTHTTWQLSPGEHTLLVTAGDPATLEGITCLFYALNLERADEALTQLDAHQLMLATYDGDQISGTIDMDSDGWLMLTVPYDDGWDVKVNGGSVEARPAFDGAMTMIPVNAGANVVELRFTTPMLAQGCVVTSATLVALCALVIVARRRRLHRRDVPLSRSAWHTMSQSGSRRKHGGLNAMVRRHGSPRPGGPSC